MYTWYTGTLGTGTLTLYHGMMVHAYRYVPMGTHVLQYVHVYRTVVPGTIFNTNMLL